MIKQAAHRNVFQRSVVVELEVKAGRLGVLKELGMGRGESDYWVR